MTHIPVRQCVACRERSEKAALMRFIAAPEGVTRDRSGRKDGRGAYLCKSEKCLKRAIKSNALGRALHAAVPEALYDEISEEITEEAER